MTAVTICRQYLSWGGLVDPSSCDCGVVCLDKGVAEEWESIGLEREEGISKIQVPHDEVRDPEGRHAEAVLRAKISTSKGVRDGFSTAARFFALSK